MKSIKPCDIIHSEEFIKEPVHHSFKELEKILTSKIILNGSGTGRSTLLHYMQEKKANTSNPFICMHFDVAEFCQEAEERFTKEFFQHYWEEKFTRRLLLYIKDYYEITYHNNFEIYEDLINKSSEETTHFINNAIYDEKLNLPRMFNSKEITEEVLNEFKKLMHIETIELGIDSFDHINNSDQLTQEILSSYFDLFERVIITTDDTSLPQQWYKTYFKEDSKLYTFQPFSIQYGKDIEVIYNIIAKRIYKYNLSLQLKGSTLEPVPIDWLNYETLDLLIMKTNGNIKMILEIIEELVKEWEFSNTITKLDIKNAIEEEENKLKRRLQNHQPKLYL